MTSKTGWPPKAHSIGTERQSTPLLLLTLERTAPIDMTLIKGHARELLDAAPDAMVIADCDGSIVYVNDRTEKLFGYTRDELIGRQVEMLLPERLRSTHPVLRVSFVRNPRQRPMSENREVYAQHRDGSEFRVEIRLSALQTDKGLLLSSTIRDITAREHRPQKTNVLIEDGSGKDESPEQARELFAARELAQEALNSIGDAVLSTDSHIWSRRFTLPMGAASSHS